MKSIKAYHKLIGVLSERAVVIYQFKLDPSGHMYIVPQDALQLPIVRKGRGGVNATVAVDRESVIPLAPGKDLKCARRRGMSSRTTIVPELM